MTMFPSACIWSYKTPLTKALTEIKQAAFHYVDIETESLDAPGFLDALKTLGLKVSCVALDHRLPSGCSLEGDNSTAQRAALDCLKQGLERCQAVGAKVAYVSPCKSRKNLKGYGSGLRELAEAAASRGIKLCVEHFPGKALETAKETLAFVEGNGHPNLYLLLDTGHALLSSEKSWEIIPAAGRKLGYVQVNDNDGRCDRHWALLDGRMTESELEKILRALKEAGYEGTLGLELKDDRASVICGLSKNRNLLLRLQQTSEPKSLKEPEARRKQ
jgi:sugar phosphate isomerase/epimerase